MKRTLVFFALALAALAACTDTSGLSAESSRTPRGNPQAAVVLEEFADLQCPACRAAHAQITGPMLERYGSRIRFEFRHFPLRSIHRFAMDAAEAAECAADQGKFWEYVDMIYAEQEKLSQDQLDSWAEKLQLDMALFHRCRASHIKRDAILADYEEGRKRGVGGTPTYFVNGQRVETGVESIGAAIEAAERGMMQKL